MLKNAEGCCRISLFVGDMNISAGQENEKKKGSKFSSESQAGQELFRAEEWARLGRDHSLEMQPLNDDL